MEFDPSAIINELGAAAIPFVILYWRLMRVEQRLSNGVVAEIRGLRKEVGLLPCKTVEICPEEEVADEA